MFGFKSGVLIAIVLAAFSLAGCSQADGKSAALPDDMAMGRPNAKITVVEYASVACPVCGHWHKAVYPAFKAKYIDTGKVRFVYREMLVGGQGEVTTAAAGFLLARCAGKDRYFPTVDAIYDSQPGLFDDPRSVLLKIGKSLGFSDDRFNTCVGDPAALKALAARVDANSRKDNVNSTPTFVINGMAMTPGDHPLNEIDDAIAAAAKR